ncbi:hypothetical protein LCD43_25325 (plasmid) [Enterobacter asburiae]|nr:hypothetical protein [Enterobacter asburiae]UOY54141.1 hypothetical protein LCD43_25325 [Enterobacter asburiae]
MAEKLMHNTLFLPLSLEKEKVKHIDLLAASDLKGGFTRSKIHTCRGSSK